VARRDDDDAVVQLNARIPKGLHRRVKVHCVLTGVPLVEFVRRALEERLARHGRPVRRARLPARAGGRARDGRRGRQCPRRDSNARPPD
jgi:hypothetical protein